MINKLMLVTMLSVGTALTTMGRLKPVAASLTVPTTYDYSYTWNATASEQYLNVNGVDSIPLYTRTADSTYFDYVSTFILVDGFDVTMDFQRSNTTWQASGTRYKPDENKIGSDGNVGSVFKKVSVDFYNQTNTDYKIIFDISSTGANREAYIVFDQGTERTYLTRSFLSSTTLREVFLFSYNKTTISFEATSGSMYFDAWYLQDLGISEAYQQGLDAETDGILTDYLGTDAQQIGWVLIGIAAILFAFKGGK